MQVGHARRALDLLARRIRARERDVLAERRGKQERLLRHPGERGSQRVQRELV
jgi:hypothetical protein